MWYSQEGCIVPAYGAVSRTEKKKKTQHFGAWGIIEVCVVPYLLCVFLNLHNRKSKNYWSITSWGLQSNKSMPLSFMYLLFKSVILIFIVTFSECSAPIGFIKKKCIVWKRSILFLDKRLQTRQRLCHSHYLCSFFYHVNIFLSIPVNS